MQKRIFPLILLLAIAGRPRMHAQSYDAQRTQVLCVNLISNALISGIGGAINRDKSEKIVKAFTRNFFKGSLGGLVKYTAKYQAYYLHSPQNAFYAPLNRLYYFLGHSMVMNAAYDRKVLERYYWNFYGIDLRYDPKAEKKLQARVSLATVEGAVEYAIRGYELNLFRTLEYGQLMFDARGKKLLPYDGQTRFNCIVLRPAGPYTSVFPHELIHSYQLYDMLPVSSFYDKKLRTTYSHNKVYKTLSKYMVLDYEALFMTTLYLAMYRPLPNYYKNYFEFEAAHFNSRAAVIR